MELDYQTIFKALNRLGIDYLLVGGLAVNFHGIPRMTYDIDLLILLHPKNILNLVAQLTRWDYRPKIAMDPMDLADEAKRNSWIQEKGMKPFHFYNNTSPVGEIDLVLESPIPFDQLKSRAIIFDLQGEKIPTVSIPDLIELKSHAGRKQDLADVEHLKLIMEK